MSQKFELMHKTVAIFMIYLTLSLIFISAFSVRVSATASPNVKVYGQDQLPGFRRSNDTTTIDVYSESNLVSILGGSGYINLSCTQISTGYKCTYSFPQQYQSPNAYSLTLQEEQNNFNAPYTVDGLPPTFSDVHYSQLGSKVRVTYTVKDRAFSGSDSCSGLNTLKLVLDENTVAEKSLNQSGCNDQGVLTTEVPGLSGNYPLYLLASDKLGNTGPTETRHLVLDTVAPMLPSTFKLLRNGQDVTKISTQGISDVYADLQFIITERDLSSVTVDVSGLTNDSTSLTPTCEQDGNHYTCTISNLLVKPANETVQIRIHAVDSKGNVADGVAVKTLSIDNTEGSVEYLGRKDPRCEDTCYVKSGENELLAVVDAPGGMLSKGLFLDFDGQTMVANNCTGNGDAWTCSATAHVEGADGTKKVLSIKPGSMDDLGNAISPAQKEFIVDNNAPTIVKQPATDLVCPTSQDTLTVKTTVKDTSPEVWIEANTSAVADSPTVKQECEPIAGGEFDCTLPITGFFSIHTKGVVPIKVVDAAGNALSMEMNLEVCEAEPDMIPNFISELGPAGDLPAVDKRIASIIPFKVVIPLKLKTIGNAQVLQVRRVSCLNDFVVGPSYVINEFTDAPVLVTNYQYEGAWPKKNVPLNCTFDFTVRRDNYVFTHPETENLSVSLPLLGNELGNPGKALKTKETKLVTEINDLQKGIKSKADIDKILGSICDLAEMMGEINSGLQALKGVLYAVALTMHATLAGAAAGQKLWLDANDMLSGFHGFITKFIWPVGWFPIGPDISFSIGYLVKWMCGLYECKMYDASTWAQIGLEIATYKGFPGLGKVPTQNPTESATSGPLTIAPDESVTPPFSNFNMFTDHQSPYYKVFNFNDYTPSYNWPKATGGIVGQAGKPKPSKNPYNYIISQNKGLVDSIPGDDWIVNPYRSTNYDSLCIPAQLYNLRKAKQLKCIELKCIKDLAKSGMPVTQCEEKYAAQSCLYLESAQARMGRSIADILQSAVAAIALQIAIGYGVQAAFRAGCKPLYDPSSITIKTWGTLPTGTQAVICGLIGTSLNLKELMSFASSLRSKNDDVPEGEDFCDGIPGVTPDDTATSGGII